MYKTYLLALAMPFVAVGCMDQGICPLAPTESLCTSNNSIYWTQPIGDPRNTPWNDPRNCSQVETDSTWVESCVFKDTTKVFVSYSQYYKDIHPDFPHCGGGMEITIVSGDTISIKEW